QESFTVDLVKFISATLTSEGGVTLQVAEAPTYDYDNYYQALATDTSTQVSTTASGYNLNTSNLSATLGLKEERELTFVGNGQTQETKLKPFAGILEVTGKENVYATEYSFDEIRDKAIERGDYEEEGSFFSELLNPTEATVAQIRQEDLTVKEVRDYKKKFHLLFNSFEYVECGPNTFPCQTSEEPNCSVGGKAGTTGINAVPKVKFDWTWNGISKNTCDTSNANYVYCDSTQAFIEILKKTIDIQEFFKSNNLTECPTALDYVGTNTNELSDTSQDVAITQISSKEEGSDVVIKHIIRTNNSKELTVKLTTTLTRKDGSEVTSVEEEKTFLSDANIIVRFSQADIGTGYFDINSTLTTIDLCDGCLNSNKTNDTISATLILGQETVQNCEEYSTKAGIFEKVLSANNMANNAILSDTVFTINLIKDGFSDDFKSDLDDYLMKLFGSDSEYKEKVRDLFLSEKFKVRPIQWRAGKYTANIIVKFNNDNWTWNDLNDIEEVVVQLDNWVKPDNYSSIYEIAFDGEVGIGTGNGRQGYGTSIIQDSEEALVLTENAGTIIAKHDPASNCVSTTQVSVVKGPDAFYSLNGENIGAILIIGTSGAAANLKFLPSKYVPLILTVNKNTSRDAYVNYIAEVDGQPQFKGPTMLQWTGIGQGCVDFSGYSMDSQKYISDFGQSSTDGYGLEWLNTDFKGLVGYKGAIYFPAESSGKLRILNSKESATFTTTNSSGSELVINTATTIDSLQKVFDAVKNEQVCVLGGTNYYWNNTTGLDKLESKIKQIEDTCIPMMSN
ncbi:MAG: hypothetical protein PHQ98_03220, partial [Candidatus ainarchaeum sp.]|nr:hypothetical protein [Candidatus ainarchaeum sp.]